MTFYDRSKELLEHVRNLYLSVEEDQDGKCLLHMMLNDCLFINGHSTNDVNKLEPTKEETKLISELRYFLAKKLSRRGRWYHALKLLEHLNYFQNKGIEINPSSGEILEKIHGCRIRVRHFIEKFI